MILLRVNETSTPSQADEIPSLPSSLTSLAHRTRLVFLKCNRNSSLVHLGISFDSSTLVSFLSDKLGFIFCFMKWKPSRGLAINLFVALVFWGEATPEKEASTNVLHGMDE